MEKPTHSMAARCLAEAIGTFILVFFGCGSVHAAVLTGAQNGIWQVAIVWGVAIMAAVYVVGGISGAHINPAITVTLACWGRFSWAGIVPYIAAQMIGAMAAAAVLLGLFSPFLEQREQERGVTRGGPGSEITAMCYGEYFPNPGGVSTDSKLTTSSEVEARLVQERSRFSLEAACAAEVVGTLLLALVVFALGDHLNPAAPPAHTAPVFVGLTVAILISVIAPLTQACFNPARDVGPRIVAYFAGWGEIAMPGPRGFLLVYVAAPVAGAILGGGLYERVLRSMFVIPSEGKVRINA